LIVHNGIAMAWNPYGKRLGLPSKAYRLA